jgi:hypothetical protein
VGIDMAARDRIQIDGNTRKKIQATQLINRLTDHILKDKDMSATQVNAALGLLKKTLPDLKQVEIDGNIDSRTTLIVKDLTGANP